LCQPLRKLTYKDVDWQWTQEQEDAFQSLTTAVTQAPVLKYFNPQAQTEGQGDASQNSLGFVLMQEGQPVTYASRALTPAEQRYSQIEKELLAQVLG
ncbi:MAG: RNase H-like domain-containing protein, partial [Cohaesibacter sp.]|nr:RNase H-like domain-containing protein [Cohaesibacter sp.]